MSLKSLFDCPTTRLPENLPKVLLGPTFESSHQRYTVKKAITSHESGSELIHSVFILSKKEERPTTLVPVRIPVN